MTYKMELIADLSVLLWSVDESFKISQDLSQVIDEATRILEELDKDVTYVADARLLKVTFSDIIFALGMLTKGELALFRQPRIKHIVGIGQSELVHFAFLALKQSQYGSLSVNFYTTLDEAFDTIKEKVLA